MCHLHQGCQTHFISQATYSPLYVMAWSGPERWNFNFHQCKKFHYAFNELSWYKTKKSNFHITFFYVVKKCCSSKWKKSASELWWEKVLFKITKMYNWITLVCCEWPWGRFLWAGKTKTFKNTVKIPKCMLSVCFPKPSSGPESSLCHADSDLNTVDSAHDWPRWTKQSPRRHPINFLIKNQDTQKMFNPKETTGDVVSFWLDTLIGLMFIPQGHRAGTHSIEYLKKNIITAIIHSTEVLLVTQRFTHHFKDYCTLILP